MVHSKGKPTMSRLAQQKKATDARPTKQGGHSTS